MSILGDLKPPCSDEVDECGIPYVLDGDGCRIHPEILVPILNAIPALEKRLEEAEKGWEAQKKLYENRCDKYHVLEAENAAMREVVDAARECTLNAKRIEMPQQFGDDDFWMEQIAWDVDLQSFAVLGSALARLDGRTWEQRPE